MELTKPSRYLIPARNHRVEEEIKRSRFITTLSYTPTVDAARDFITQVGAEMTGANHNCWAYVVGPPGHTAQIGLSDAGEPHGTAGRPMLTVLLHSGIGDICAVVTRYFGGALLGKGGLVKAYGGGVQAALAGLVTVERVPSVEIRLTIQYPAVTPVKRLLADYEAELLHEDYRASVTYQIRLPQDQLAPFTTAINSITNGQATIESVA